jgi:hypothetical protein
MSLNKFGISKGNENFRKTNGYPTIESLLDGTSIEDVIPSPLKCECGHYPLINRIEDKHSVRCQGCNITYSFIGSYSNAILQWNLRKNVPFNANNKKQFHPYIDLRITDDISVIKSATKAMNQKLFKQRNTKSKQERNLVSLMIDWNNFSCRLTTLYHQNPNKFGRID